MTYMYLEDRLVSGKGAEEKKRKKAKPGKRPEYKFPLGPGVAKACHDLAHQVGGVEDREEQHWHPVEEVAGHHLRLHAGEDGHGDQVAGGDGQHVRPDQGHHLQAPSKATSKTLTAEGSIPTLTKT